MIRLVERLLNLQPGDLGRGILLFSYLFLIMASYMMARIARDAIFLGQFRADQLAYGDIAIAIIVGFVVAGYIRAGRGLSLRNLLVGSLLFFAVNCLVFWWLSYNFQFAWLSPVIYVWVGMFGVLAVSQVWTLANHVLTVREAKRIFGLVGSGAILGAILGGKFASISAEKFGTESMFLAMVIALTICSFLVIRIWKLKRYGEEILGKEKSQNFTESLRLVWRSPYLQAIAGLILAASLVTSIAGWQFKALVKHFYQEKDAIAAFFGEFYFWAGLAGLLMQLLLTSRFLRKFGLGPALFIVPVALTIGTIAVLGLGTITIWAAISLRGSINLFQYSIDKSTVELLYLPIPSNIKVQVKSFIDTVIWRLGDGFGGVAVLLFIATLGWSAQQIGWVNLVFILGWVAAALVARRQYVGALRTSIQEHRLDTERALAPVLDRSTADIFAKSFTTTDTNEILYALGLFEVSNELAAHPAMRGLLQYPAAEVRKKALTILAATGDKSIRPEVEKLLQDQDFEVRTEAMLYLAHHAHVDPLTRIQEMGDFPEFSTRAAIVAFMAQPGDSQDLDTARMIFRAMAEDKGERTRLEAARLLCVLPDHFEEELELLFGDSDLEVKKCVIQAIGKRRKRRYVPRLFEMLADSDLAPTITETLAEFGDRIVGTMRDYLSDTTMPIAMRREIADTLGRIGTAGAARVLGESIIESDTKLRFHIITALNKLHKQHPEIEVDKSMIEMLLAAEIMGHYRSYQILGTLGGELNSDDPIARGLQETMKQELERIFRLLSLLFPHYDLHSAYFGLQTGNAVVRDNALEFLDNILKPEIRSVLVPVLDGEVGLDERVRLANQMVGAAVESREEAVEVLIKSNDPWLKSCGAYAIGTLGLTSLEKELDQCLVHDDPLLRETARQAKLRLSDEQAS